MMEEPNVADMEKKESFVSKSSKVKSDVAIHLLWRDISFDVPVDVVKEGNEESRWAALCCKKPDEKDTEIEEVQMRVIEVGDKKDKLGDPSVSLERKAAAEDGEEPQEDPVREIESVGPVPEEEQKQIVPFKRILQPQSAQVKPGEMVAVMGPSGSGKSSLLNILAGEIIEGVSGKIFVNGHHEENPQAYRRFLGYVVQEDCYFNILTVEETINFSAKLKLPHMTADEKKERCRNILEELDLTHIRNSRIGEVGKGISGGERRRLAIGLELLNNPSILFLDEPTSGLDSASALMITKLLRRLADQQNRTIMCTLHQPRSTVLQMFDKLLLLGEGRVVYFGSTGDECVEFFAENGFNCPRFENPADFMLDLINFRLTEEEKLDAHGVVVAIVPGYAEDCAENGNNEEVPDRHENIIKLSESYEESKYKESALEVPKECRMLDPLPDMGEFKRVNFFIQFWVLLQRSFLHKLREPIAAVTQGFNSIFLPLIIGSIFWQLSNDQPTINDRRSVISFIVLFQGFMTYDILLLFPSERSIYMRESSAGLYTTSAFYFGRTFAEFPFHVVFTFCNCCIGYWMIGLQADVAKFFNFVIIVEMVTLTGASFMLFAGSVSKQLEQSNLVATFFLVFFMLFDGTWISVNSIPKVYQWFRHLSFLGLGVRSAIYNEMTGLTFTCKNETRVSLGGLCPYNTGLEVLVEDGMDDENIAVNMLWLLLMCVVYRGLAYLGLRFLFTGHSLKRRWKDTC